MVIFLWFFSKTAHPLAQTACGVFQTDMNIYKKGSALPLHQAGVTWRRSVRIYGFYKGAGVGCLLLLWAVFFSLSNLKLFIP